MSGNGRYIAYLSNNLLASVNVYTVQIWNISTKSLLYTLKNHTSYINSLLQLSNGLLASGSSDSSINVWNVYTGALVISLRNEAGISSLLQTSTGLLIGGVSKTIKLFKLANLG